jgi:hypothetical protein
LIGFTRALDGESALLPPRRWLRTESAQAFTKPAC